MAATSAMVSMAQAPLANSRLLSLKEIIERVHKADPKTAIKAEEEALGIIASSPKGDPLAPLWYLESAARDHGVISSYEKALAFARQANSIAMVNGTAADKVRTETLLTRSLVNAEIIKEAKIEAERLVQAINGLPVKGNEALLASAYRTLGSVHSNSGNLASSVDAYTQAMRLYDSTGNILGRAQALGAIADVQVQLNRHKEAVDNLNTAISIAGGSGDKALQAGFRLSLSNAYGRIEDTERQAEELALAYALAKESGDDQTALTATVNLADVSLRQKNYPKTILHAEQAMTLARAVNDKSSIAVCLINKGISVNRLGNRTEGMALINEGFEHFVKTDAKSYVAEIQGVLAEEYAFNQDYKNAYQSHIEFKKLSDAIVRADDQKHMAEASAAYENDKKQGEINALKSEQLHQSRLRNLWIISGLLGLATTVTMVISKRKLAKVNEALEGANEALEDMSLRDPLTGLNNRRYLTTRIDEDVAQVARTRRNVDTAEIEAENRLMANIDLAFLMLDVDHFKQVNDVHGHAAGDAVLKQLSQILVATARDSDSVVRWGGEEFLIVAKNTSRADVHILAERLRRNVAKHEFVIDESLSIHKTCSIGFACFPFSSKGRPLGWESILDLADQCLYVAKNSGRDMWVGIRTTGLEDATPASWVDAFSAVESGEAQFEHTDGRDVQVKKLEQKAR